MPKLLLDNEIRAGVLIHYNEQNLEIMKRMRAGNGKQLIILEWPYQELVTTLIEAFQPDSIGDRAEVQVQYPYKETRRISVNLPC